MILDEPGGDLKTMMKSESRTRWTNEPAAIAVNGAFVFWCPYDAPFATRSHNWRRTGKG
jgi:hypothetical protein